MDLIPQLDFAVAGQALSVRQAHRKFGRCYAEFVSHAGNGRDVLVRKLISSTWNARWSNPLRVKRADVIAVHDHLARREA